MTFALCSLLLCLLASRCLSPAASAATPVPRGPCDGADWFG